MEHIFEDEIFIIFIGLALGFAVCFWGYRLQKVWIAVITFILGFRVFKNIISHFTSYQGAIVGCAFILGLILAGLSFNIYLIGLFLAAAGAAIWVSCQYISNQWAGLLVGVIAGVFVGLLAIRANRPAVILLTGILGGMSVGKYMMQLLILIPQKSSFFTDRDWMKIVVGALAAISGSIIQFKSSVRSREM